MKKYFPFLIILLLFLTGCGGNRIPKGFYQPEENADMDYTENSFRWSFSRSLETDHFILFWEPDFGDNPNSDSLPETMRVDVADLSEKLENFYETETKTLGFGTSSLLNGYKLQVYLLYTDDWVATGSGYDNQIGALWISPSTCKPAGSVIAHEVGHCFQYLIYCEQLANGQSDADESGFRYSYGNELGNAFWEISAQWQSWQDYPSEQFTDYEMDTWFQNYFRAFEHEWTRYQNYWLITSMSEHYGKDWLSTIWRESRYDEDALSCHMRIYLHNDLDKLYSELYTYASHAVTFDFEASKGFSADWQGYYDAVLYPSEDGWQQIAYANTPEANGFSAVKLSLPENGVLHLSFEGLQPGSALAANDPGICLSGEDPSSEDVETETVRTYNSYDSTPGWRYGIVALLSDGTREYGPMQETSTGEITYDVSPDTEFLYLVVLGTPEQYVPHIWDNTEKTDVQMPYRIKILSE